MWIAASSYLGLTVLVTWQALRAESLIAPSGPTLAALAGLVIVTLASALLVLATRHPQANVTVQRG